jgi:hypothetical protein
VLYWNQIKAQEKVLGEETSTEHPCKEKFEEHKRPIRSSKTK